MEEKGVKVLIRKVTPRKDGNQAILRIPVSVWRAWQAEYIQMIISKDEIVIRPLRKI